MNQPATIKATGIALLIAALCSCFMAQGQQSDTLKEVRIKTKRKQAPVSNDARVNVFSPGQKVNTVDSFTLQQYQFQNIANLLTQQTPVFIRSYGFNGLATLNFRGASSAQSQVYWNGVPIQNAASGAADVSLLPVALINKVNIVYGGSASLWGSGNVGGALLLENNEAVFDSNGKAAHSLSAVAGSFGQYQLGLRSSVSLRKWYLSANLFGQTAQNDFCYRDRFDDSIVKQQTNSKLYSGTAMISGAYRIDDKNTVGLYAWYQQYYREIPPALFEAYSVKNRRDESLRILLDWERVVLKSTVYVKAAYIRDYMQYRDTISFPSDSISTQTYVEAGYRYSLSPRHHITVFAPVQVSWLYRQVMRDVKYQRRTALVAAYAGAFLDDRLKTSVSARGEVIDDKTIFLPGVNASYELIDGLTVRANLQRTYRAPSLNELYFFPGGNAQLKPEHGWSMDAGYNARIRLGDNVVLTHDLSVFSRVIEDWIIWFGGAIWTPHNIAKVHSRGIETENRLQLQFGRWRPHIGINTGYVLATTLDSYQPGDGSIGKQIPYTPRYNGQVNIGFTYGDLYFNYNHGYTGYRFVTTDESQYLLPYHTGNIQAFYTAYVRSMPLQLTLQLNNIWDSDYEVVNARPMPGFNWRLGLRATLAN